MTPLETLIKSKVPRLEGYEVKALAEAISEFHHDELGDEVSNGVYWEARAQGGEKQRDAAWAMVKELTLNIEGAKNFIEGIRDLDYHSEGMGCGLEDRGITDRYEAMRYGWNEALERSFDGAPDIEELSELIAKAKALR